MPVFLASKFIKILRWGYFGAYVINIIPPRRELSEISVLDKRYSVTFALELILPTKIWSQIDTSKILAGWRDFFLICDALRDLVPFVQFKNMKNTHGRVLHLSCMLKPAILLNSTLRWMFFTLFKLDKW